MCLEAERKMIRRAEGNIIPALVEIPPPKALTVKTRKTVIPGVDSVLNQHLPETASQKKFNKVYHR